MPSRGEPPTRAWCYLTTMSIPRVILAILLPPLAVLGRGCGSFVIVTLLTLAGWVPGVIAALVILNKAER